MSDRGERGGQGPSQWSSHPYFAEPRATRHSVLDYLSRGRSTVPGLAADIGADRGHVQYAVYRLLSTGVILEDGWAKSPLGQSCRAYILNPEECILMTDEIPAPAHTESETR